jgi:hypothetical protein
MTDEQAGVVIQNCLRARHDPSAAGNLADITARADWERVGELAARNRALPLVYLALERYCPELSRSPHVNGIARGFYRNAARCMLVARELAGIARDFDRAGIDVLPFKGVALAAAYYGTEAARGFGDLDLLVRRADMKRGAEMLLARGYQFSKGALPAGLPELEWQFEKPGETFVTDLRWRITSPWFSSTLDLDSMWERRASTSLAGATIPIMGPEDTLLVLCFHGTKHNWTRWIWVADVAEALSATRALVWDSLRIRAARARLWNTVRLGVRMAADLLNAPAPEAVLLESKRRRAVDKLAHNFESVLLRQTPPGPSRPVPHYISLLEPRDRFRYYLYRYFRPVFDRVYSKFARSTAC